MNFICSIHSVVIWGNIDFSVLPEYKELDENGWKWLLRRKKKKLPLPLFFLPHFAFVYQQLFKGSLASQYKASASATVCRSFCWEQLDPAFKSHKSRQSKSLPVCFSHRVLQRTGPVHKDSPSRRRRYGLSINPPSIAPPVDQNADPWMQSPGK